MCELCLLEGGLKITICRTCGIPMVVSYDHKPGFSEAERELVKRIFPTREIRWEQRQIHNHAHCHIED